MADQVNTNTPNSHEEKDAAVEAILEHARGWLDHLDGKEPIARHTVAANLRRVIERLAVSSPKPASVAEEMVAFEAAYPFCDSTKHGNGEVVAGRVRYAEPEIDKMFSAWLSARAALRATPTPGRAPEIELAAKAVMDMLAEHLPEGFHKGLRMSDAADSGVIWNAISRSRTTAWSDAWGFAFEGVKEPIVSAIRALGRSPIVQGEG